MDKIFNSYVDAHNFILEKIIDANKNKKSYTLKDARRDVRENLENNILDSGTITFLFHELNRKIRNGESVELKEYGGDHSYRTSVSSTKIKDGRLYIPYFKEGGIKLKGYTNIRGWFTSVKISRESNKYYVIFGYDESVKKRKDIKGKKYVYIIYHPASEGYYKVGIAKNYKSRLNSYQPGDAYRRYRMEYIFLTSEYNAEMIEKSIHKMFPNKHEWVKANLQDIIKEIERLDEEFNERKKNMLKRLQIQR